MSLLDPLLRHGRAVFVVVHLFAITAVGLPSVGGGMSRSAWKTPTVQNEFRVWQERLRGWGYPITMDELEEGLWQFAMGYERGRAKLLRPFKPYFEYCGTWQSWRMFVAPHRFPGRLEIHVDGGRKGWQPVYVARSDEHAWMHTIFDHDRLRAATFRYAWAHFRGPRQQFANWVATQAAQDFPEAARVRVSFVRYRTRTPDEVRAGEEAKEKRELSSQRRLERYR
ncbi:MAG: hypothetical protein KTR31_07595 [Myxococcales bacterium]|nr:hypothetical protein [Myxococcales bacterium]